MTRRRTFLRRTIVALTFVGGVLLVTGALVVLVVAVGWELE